MIRGFVQKTLQQRSHRYQVLNQIVLDKQRLLNNVSLIQKRHSAMKIMPVLKGNAYGHGLQQVAEILNDAKVEMLAVDGYFEAAAIRHITKHRILVMGYILPENLHLLDTRRCSFVVQDITGLEAFGRLKKPVRIHLELNTGMNRLGLSAGELDQYLLTLKRFPKLQLEGVMSHLADADNESDDSFTEMQARLFDAQVQKILAAGFNPGLIHLAQTAGSTKVHSQFANALRLGIGMYGISPLSQNDEHQADLAKLQPVLQLQSTIIKVIELKKGDKVSYNGTFEAPKSMRIGILPLGYYEGVPRALSNAGFATSAETRLPIIGRVCMNHTIIDLTNTELKIGDLVTLISNNLALPNSIVALQSNSKLFSYNVLTALAPTVRRKIA